MSPQKSKSQEQIEKLHAAYQRLTKMDVGLRFNRESSWHEFIRQGFTEADLEAVVARLIALIKIGERKPECLKFSNLIEALDRFEEERAMVKSEKEGIKVGMPTPSVWEANEKIKFIKEEQQELVDRHADECSTGLYWNDLDAKRRFFELNRKLREIRNHVLQ